MKHYSVITIAQCRRLHTVSGTLLFSLGLVNAGFGIERISLWGIWDRDIAVIVYCCFLAVMSTCFIIKELHFRDKWCFAHEKDDKTTHSIADAIVEPAVLDLVMNGKGRAASLRRTSDQDTASSSSDDEGDAFKRVRRSSLAILSRLGSMTTIGGYGKNQLSIVAGAATGGTTGSRKNVDFADAENGGNNRSTMRRGTAGAGIQTTVGKIVSKARKSIVLVSQPRKRQLSITSARRIAIEIGNDHGRLYPKLTWADVGERVAVGAQLVVLANRVYDIPQYVPSHPGGELVLIDHIGADVTKLVSKHKYLTQTY